MSKPNLNNDYPILKAMTLPHVGVLVGALLSMVAWMLPALSSAGKGFIARPTETLDVFWTIAAYLGIAAAAAAGFFIGKPIGRRIPKPHAKSDAGLCGTGVWTFWILLAGVGVSFALLRVVGAFGIGGCIRCIASFNANALKAVLYTDYSMGVLSLRYVAILAGGVAIFRYLAFREVSMRSVISLLLLMVVAIMSSRLSVIWAGVIGVTTYLLAPCESGKRRISLIEFMSWSGVFVVLMGALTISRTFGYYQKRGADTFVAASASEFQRYLAAPFQGSIEAVNHPERKSRLNESAGIDGELSTNSAFLQLAGKVGKWNLVGLAAILFCSGTICGMVSRLNDTYFIFILGILQSCHLEIWRILMFPQGLTLTILFFAITIPTVLAIVRLPSFGLPAIRLRVGRSTVTPHGGR